MEDLPQEIVDKILDRIWEEDPQDLYRLRRVSKMWKDIIDQYTSRLLKVWRKKCSDAIPMSYRNDFVQTQNPQFATWRAYCSSKPAVPHIARDIYASLYEFPNLVGQPHYTEICPPKTANDKFITAYAVNDKYFAVSMLIGVSEDQQRLDWSSRIKCRTITRVYSINDLTRPIREYPIVCERMDFCVTDNHQLLIVVLRNEEKYRHCYQRERTFMSKFLVDDSLVSANLHPKNFSQNSEHLDYAITKNQCFTFNDGSRRSFTHHRLTSNGFEMSTVVQLPHLENGSRLIEKIQICNSKLIVFCVEISNDRKEIIYAYKITRQPDDKLLFSDPEIYENKSTIWMYIGAENISPQHIILDCCQYYKLRPWMELFLNTRYPIYSATVFAHHVIILCRGNFQELANFVTTNTDPGSRCTVIKLKYDIDIPDIKFKRESAIHVIHRESKPKFLLVTPHRVFTIDFPDHNS